MSPGQEKAGVIEGKAFPLSSAPLSGSFQIVPPRAENLCVKDLNSTLMFHKLETGEVSSSHHKKALILSGPSGHYCNTNKQQELNIISPSFWFC